MQLPKLQININLDIGYAEESSVQYSIAATKQERRLPYTEYSEFRDYIRSIFDNRSKYKLLGYVPSNKAKEDRLRLSNITLPSKNNVVDPYGAYRQQIDNYLKTPPVSQSFYIVTSVLDDLGNPVCDWEVFIRISNHADSVESISEAGINKKKNFIGDTFRRGDKNFELVPIWFTISCDVKNINNIQTKTYQLDITKGLDTPVSETKSTLEEIKQYTSNYIEDIRQTCISQRANFGSSTINNTVAINSNSHVNFDYSGEANIILSDLEDAIIKFNEDLMETGEFEYEDYIWTCDYINIDNNGDVDKIHVSDNFGGSYIIRCDFNVKDYFSDHEYRESELYELALALFDGYDWI